MKILNTFKYKIGSGGRRNRARRRRLIRRGHIPTTQEQNSTLPVLTKSEFIETMVEFGQNLLKQNEAVKLDLAGLWDETITRKALTLFEQSGKSQRAFCAEQGFSDSKLRSWKKKLET